MSGSLRFLITSRCLNFQFSLSKLTDKSARAYVHITEERKKSLRAPKKVLWHFQSSIA